MDHKRVYDAIVKNRQENPLTCYTEEHHIIPSCMGGPDTKDNLVNLTAKEHFVCHQLLCKIYPKERGLIFAAWMMSNCKNEHQQRVTGRVYKWLREAHSKAVTERQTGLKRGPNKKVDKRKGKTMAEIYGSDYKHAQAQPFKVTSSQGTEEYSCTLDFVKRSGMGAVQLHKLKKAGELKIKRIKNTKHNYIDGEVIKLEFVVDSKRV